MTRKHRSVFTQESNLCSAHALIREEPVPSFSPLLTVKYLLSRCTVSEASLWQQKALFRHFVCRCCVINYMCLCVVSV